jgi:hypothetical protein
MSWLDGIQSFPVEALDLFSHRIARGSPHPAGRLGLTLSIGHAQDFLGSQHVTDRFAPRMSNFLQSVSFFVRKFAQWLFLSSGHGASPVRKWVQPILSQSRQNGYLRVACVTAK